jgi:hypothetical protein
MIRVKISTPFPEWPLERQIPGRKAIWGNCQFFIDQDIEECDYWVVYDSLSQPEVTRCPEGNTILITGEPKSVKRYSKEYINQFGAILTCHRNLDHAHVINSQQALPWMIGRRYFKETKTWENGYSKGYDEFSKIISYDKTKVLSIILSKKAGTDGHKKREKFIKKLKADLGDIFDVFGIGFNDLQDKWDGIAPYKYYLALENSSVRDYWTEKLSDAYLGGAYPIYYGCPNIYQYFNEQSLSVIDINKTGDAISMVNKIITSGLYEKSQKEILEAKQLILNQYNLFAVIENLIAQSNNQVLQKYRPTRLINDKTKSTFIKSLFYKVKKTYYYLKYI